MKTIYYQIAMESTGKPGSYRLLVKSYSSQEEAHASAEEIRSQSRPQFRAPSFKVYRITREVAGTFN